MNQSLMKTKRMLALNKGRLTNSAWNGPPQFLAKVEHSFFSLKMLASWRVCSDYGIAALIRETRMCFLIEKYDLISISL